MLNTNHSMGYKPPSEPAKAPEKLDDKSKQPEYVQNEERRARESQARLIKETF